MTQAILFDFDGVVVQSELLHRETFLEVLRPLGIDVSKERWYNDFAGTGSRNIFSVLIKEAKLDIDVHEIVEHRKKIYAKRVINGDLKLTDGIKQFLESIRKKGIKTAVVSGGHRPNVEIALKKLSIDHLFDLVIGAEDVSNRKPDPECYLKAAKILRVEPEQCIVVEDSPAGSEAAKSANMKLVLVESPASKGLKGYVAIISKFSEFPLELIDYDNT